MITLEAPPVEYQEQQTPDIEESGRKGRPKFMIRQDLLQYFLEMNIPVSQMAERLGVHRSTIHECMK